ncbi:MAG: hypothetical protein RIR18_1749 [Pseudomonadota bacterium]|jgi:heptosyltransferase-3
MATAGLRILVIGIARIGDTLLLTPCLRAIKTALPDAHLTVFAHPKRADILERFEPIDQLTGTTKQRLALRGWLPGKDYDVAFVYGRDTLLLNYAIRASKQVFCFDEAVFSPIQSPTLHKVSLPPFKSKRAVEERMMLVDAFLGHDATRNKRLGLNFSTAEIAIATQWLQQKKIADRHPLIGLQIHSFPTKSHRDWPTQHFLALIQGILGASPEAHFLILGDQLAAQKSTPFTELFPAAISVAAGEMNLRHSAALMSLLDLYVGVDTGPTHIAGALGIPMVAMYHHKYWGRNLMPIDNPLCRAIEHPETGNLEATSGMEAIPAQQVLQLSIDLLHQKFGQSV